MITSDSPLRPLRGLASFLVPLLALVALSDVVNAALVFLAPSRRTALEDWMMPIHTTMSLLLCIWLYRAHRNLERGKVPHLRYAHWWAWAGFIIPFVNLYRPVQFMKETLWGSIDLRGLDARVQSEGEFSRANGLINLWWAAYVAGLLVYVFFVKEEQPPGPATAVADGLLAVSTFILIYVTWRVSNLQEGSVGNPAS